MTVDIQPTKLGHQHWVVIKLAGGGELQRGPYSNADEAEAAAAGFAARCRALFPNEVRFGVAPTVRRQRA